MSYNRDADFFHNPPSTFISGYKKPGRTLYHNIGQLQTPYIGKGWKIGDYGPPQRTKYYRPDNRHYPYPLDRDLNPLEILPEGGPCCYPRNSNTATRDCFERNYPKYYIPEEYFLPQKLASPYNYVQRK